MSYLPNLRNGLQLLDGGQYLDGSRRWSVYDPLQHKYFELDQRVRDIFSVWTTKCESIEDLKLSVSQIDAAITDAEIEETVSFAIKERLVECVAIKELVAQAESGSKSLLHKIIHGYLFFKIPILRPDVLLDEWAPRLKFLRSRYFLGSIILLSFLGLLSIIEQLDEFLATLPTFLTPLGLFSFSFAFVLLKLSHEMGHALSAKWRNVRVSSMGIAFLVLFPILYTDTTDSWRLRNNQDRLKIVTAGLKVELAMAGLAMFFWGILEPGILKSICFALVISGVISSLLVNLSPFLRFDGYFALSDILNMPNLQSRAFDLARWFLRSKIIGISQQLPEHHRPGKLSFLIIYSFLTWIYRFFLFLGIAILVYKIDFKLLGIFLFLVEIYYFIARPILRETKFWYEHRNKIKITPINTALVFGLVSVLFWGFLSEEKVISIPAIASPAEVSVAYPSSAGMVTHMLTEPGIVQAGDVLATVVPIELETELDVAKLNLKIAELQLLQTTIQPDKIASYEVARKNKESATLEYRQQLSKQENVTIRAASTGYWQPSVRQFVGKHVNQTTSLGELTQLSRTLIEGFIPIESMDRIADGGVFKSYDEVLRLEFAETEQIPLDANVLHRKEMADINGGPIIVRMSEGQYVTEAPVVKISALVDEPYRFSFPIQGRIETTANLPAPFVRLWQSIANLLISESGF